MKSLELNKKFLKAVSSRSRISILKTLGSKNYTVTELSKSLNLSKSTVHEHLSVLLDGELVAKNEDGRKWVYYGLTEKGKHLIHNDIEKMIVLFPMSVAVFLSGLYSIMFLKPGTGERIFKSTFDTAGALAESSDYASVCAVTESVNTIQMYDLNLVIGIGLILISLLMIYHVISKLSIKNA